MRSREYLYSPWEINQNPVDIAKAAIEHAKSNDLNVVILDTAGRLHVDEDYDGRAGEYSEGYQGRSDNICCGCHDRSGCSQCCRSPLMNRLVLDGVILTKMDGDTRGGAALSIRAVTGKPILICWYG